ncbi:hypothetical protein R1flu_007994 [Riccia fluitans]|uniref:Uncharacterized protein n=1 Tax=Riccia fluitans TaxID=41844 RepID=A0ABD1YE35_9MARC
MIYHRFRADPPCCGSAPGSFFLSRFSARTSELWGTGNTSFARILGVVDPHRTTDFSSLRVMRSPSELWGMGVGDIRPSSTVSFKFNGWATKQAPYIMRAPLLEPTLRVMGFCRCDDLGNVRTLRGWIGMASGCTLWSGTFDRDPRRAWNGFVYRGCAGTKVAAARAVFLLRASGFRRLFRCGGSAMDPFARCFSLINSLHGENCQT